MNKREAAFTRADVQQGRRFFSWRRRGDAIMEHLSKRDKHTIRFLEWILKYPGWWFLICTPGDEHMNLQMMKMLIDRLAKEQFYEIIFVLLMVHRNEEFMDPVFKTLLLEMIIAGWKGETKDKGQIISALKDLLT